MRKRLDTTTGNVLSEVLRTAPADPKETAEFCSALAFSAVRANGRVRILRLLLRRDLVRRCKPIRRNDRPKFELQKTLRHRNIQNIACSLPEMRFRFPAVRDED